MIMTASSAASTGRVNWRDAALTNACLALGNSRDSNGPGVTCIFAAPCRSSCVAFMDRRLDGLGCADLPLGDVDANGGGISTEPHIKRKREDSEAELE